MTDLLWNGPQRPGRGPKPALNLERIVAAAIEVADAEGLTALSMQRIAAQLGSGTMSLYRHVPGKEELINLMLDAAIGEPPALDGTSWRDNLTIWAHSSFALYRRHPWTLATVGGKRMLGPNETAWTDTALRALADCGLTGSQQLQAVFTVNGYVRGSAQISPDHGPVLNWEALSRPEVAQRYPHLIAVFGTELEIDDGIDFGLRSILDGIEALLQRRS